VEFEGLLAQLDPRPDRRGREFERICRWYLQNAAEYRSRVRHVWLWDEWPGRWAADAGIDLVAETLGGDLWAVQAKAYDPSYAIKKADIDSFLSESARSEFSYRLLMATTDRIGHTARRTLAGQEKPAGLLLRSQLGLADVEWPRSPEALAPPRLERRRPLPHQRKAVSAMVRGFRAADRGQLIMACGTGKTLAACFLAQKLAARKVLVLVPSLSLLAQTLREWAVASEFDYLAVCSDETVAGDAVVASTSELGIPVTTDPAEIAAFLRRREQDMRVVFATYQSSPRIVEAQTTHTPGFDLVIADEAHRCAGPEGGVFATVLDPKKIRASKRLFMTATPRYFTGRLREEASEADWAVASMDDESRFGPVLHRLSFGLAIDKGLLSDYQVAVVAVSDSTYREYAERGVFVTPDGEVVTDARTLASQLGLLRAMARYDLSRVVTFHSRIWSASTFAGSLPYVCSWLPSDRQPVGTLWADHVSGRMTSGERDIRLNRLRSVGAEERGVLANARCLAEGVDVPTLDGVAFIEPRRSQVDVVQAVGRAIRRADDKTVGTVVIPVFVDESGDPESALEAGEFDRVWQVLKALRAHDEVLAEELDELRRQLGRRGTSKGRPRKIVLDLPVRIGDRFARAFDARLIAETTDGWQFWFGLLQQYADQHGSVADVNYKTEVDGYKVGQWVLQQRQQKKRLPGNPRGILRPERVRLLESVPGWSWQAQVSRWEHGFAQLVRFAESHGHTNVPRTLPRDRVKGRFDLGAWVDSQRQQRRHRGLSPDRSARLEALPGWTWDPQDDKWEEGFQQLLRYVEQHGDAEPTFVFIQDGFRLGRWVKIQRTRWKEGRIRRDRQTRLESVPGWVWKASKRPAKTDRGWAEHFRSLEQFVQREGHPRVPRGHVEDGKKLGLWVSNQRGDYRRGASWMTADRVQRLEALPGWVWDARAPREEKDRSDDAPTSP
jgi:superfamily II DNA or RNA helicase